MFKKVLLYYPPSPIEESSQKGNQAKIWKSNLAVYIDKKSADS